MRKLMLLFTWPVQWVGNHEMQHIVDQYFGIMRIIEHSAIETLICLLVINS